MKLAEKTGEHQRFDEATKDEVIALIKEFGRPKDLEEAQNDSPTVAEFLAMAEQLPTIRYIGYIIHKPRDDWRVSVEGFTASSVDADTALSLMQDQCADEKDHTKNEDGTYNLSFWWD